MRAEGKVFSLTFRASIAEHGIGWFRAPTDALLHHPCFQPLDGPMSDVDSEDFTAALPTVENEP
jgi:hypothetical protein